VLSGALCDDFFVLGWLSIQAMDDDAGRMSAYPSSPLSSLHTTVAFSYSPCCAPGACCILMQAIEVTNLAASDTEQTSIDGNRAQ